MIRELCMVNFRAELYCVDGLLDQTVPQPRRDITRAQFEIERSNHLATRRALITSALGYPGIVPDAYHDFGIASPQWPERYSALKALWTLMNTWPGPKEMIWRRGIDNDVGLMAETDRKAWERALVRFYVQSVFNVLGHVPSLPRRLS